MLQFCPVRIPLKAILDRAPSRPKDYVEKVLGAGRLMPDMTVEIPDAAWQLLVAEFSAPAGHLRGVRNAFAAVLRWWRAGCPMPSPAAAAARLPICRPCDAWRPNSWLGWGGCGACGCSKAKLWMPSEGCPRGIWGPR